MIMLVSFSRIQQPLPLPSEDLNLVKIKEIIRPKPKITDLKCNTEQVKINKKLSFMYFNKTDFYYLEMSLSGFSTQNVDNISLVFIKLELGELIIWEINLFFKKIIVTERGHLFLEKWKKRQKRNKI